LEIAFFILISFSLMLAFLMLTRDSRYQNIVERYKEDIDDLETRTSKAIRQLSDTSEDIISRTMDIIQGKTIEKLQELDYEIEIIKKQQRTIAQAFNQMHENNQIENQKLESKCKLLKKTIEEREAEIHRKNKQIKRLKEK